jgi:hypothetical protein
LRISFAYVIVRLILPWQAALANYRNLLQLIQSDKNSG